MTTNKIHELLEKRLSIPTLPDVVVKIRQAIDDPEAGMREIGSLIAQDAPLMAKVLRIANSSYYGLAGRCISPEQACTVLGMRALRNIVNQVAIMDAFKNASGGYDVKDIWDHSLQTAQVAAFLARRGVYRTLLNPAEFYTCGLLHDIGKVFMLSAMGDAYMQALEDFQAGDNLVACEQERFGFDHAAAGAFVANHWELPEAIKHSIEFHHGPLNKISNDPAVAIVYVANCLVEETAGEDLTPLVEVLDEPAASSLGISEEDAIAVARYVVELRNAAIAGQSLDDGAWLDDGDAAA